MICSVRVSACRNLYQSCTFKSLRCLSLHLFILFSVRSQLGLGVSLNEARLAATVGEKKGRCSCVHCMLLYSLQMPMLSSEKVNFDRVGVVPWVDAVVVDGVVVDGVVEYEVAPKPFLDLVSDDRVGMVLALVCGGGGVCPFVVFILALFESRVVLPSGHALGSSSTARR